MYKLTQFSGWSKKWLKENIGQKIDLSNKKLVIYFLSNNVFGQKSLV